MTQPAAARQPDASPAEINLDPAEIGAYVIKTVLISHQLGHVCPNNSVGYLHPDEPEARFVVDVIAGRTTADLCERYLGGERNARAILRASFARANR